MPGLAFRNSCPGSRCWCHLLHRLIAVLGEVREALRAGKIFVRSREAV